jgi:hypothetical protein
MKAIIRIVSMFVGVSLSAQIMAQALPVPSLSIDFDPHSLAQVGAQFIEGQNFTFVTGKDGRPAVEFHGVHRPGVIKIPNREQLRFVDGASFDMWIKVNRDEGMDGWGNPSKTSWGMSLIAKAHDRNGFALISNTINGESTKRANGRFQAFDQTWSGLVCEENENFIVVNYGQWYRLTAVVSSTTGTHIYVNKQLSVSCLNARPSFKATNEQDLFIGRFKDQWYPFHGAIQDLRIYQIALTEKQVKALP